MQWIRSQRPGESGVNIITADFVELGDFISAVITLNYYLGEDDEEDATWTPAFKLHLLFPCASFKFQKIAFLSAFRAKKKNEGHEFWKFGRQE